MRQVTIFPLATGEGQWFDCIIARGGKVKTRLEKDKFLSYSDLGFGSARLLRDSSFAARRRTALPMLQHLAKTLEASSLSEWIGIKALAGKNAANPDRNRLKPRLQSILSDRLLVPRIIEMIPDERFENL